jgi:hypothetical protein
MKTMRRLRELAVCCAASLLLPAGNAATEPATPTAAATAAAVPQRQFSTPEEAVKTLLAATKDHDRTALREIFGPQGHELVSGDRVADRNEFATFARALAQLCRLSYEGPDKVVLNIGSQDWPFPIPLVKKDGQWSFDTLAGKEEIIDRRVGENELIAIGVCRTYVQAQRDYASDFRDDSGVLKYAQHLKSTPGKKDGLFWKVAPGEEPSPFGPLVASARAQGYLTHKTGEGPPPFHGYLFKILTAQGPHAPGGAFNYIINDNMLAGFALVAHPIRWGDSGIMTFIVNQQGKVYQANLGPDTAAKVAAMTEFDPDSAWTLVSPPGD